MEILPNFRFDFWRWELSFPTVELHLVVTTCIVFRRRLIQRCSRHWPSGPIMITSCLSQSRQLPLRDLYCFRIDVLLYCNVCCVISRDNYFWTFDENLQFGNLVVKALVNYFTDTYGTYCYVWRNSTAHSPE